MEKYYGTLLETGMFNGIIDREINSILSCLGAKIKVWDKNTMIINLDDCITEIGIVLSGRVQIAKADEAGNKVIITEISQGGLFGEVFVCAGVNNSPVMVIAMEKSEIMFMGFKKLMAPCSPACDFHMKMIENMLKIIANKNLLLNEKMDILTKKTTREKLISFLTLQKKQAHKEEFTIAFNREELADFLSVNRSALSRELSKMRDEGLVEFDRNRFKIHF